jgi:hypothetical protein
MTVLLLAALGVLVLVLGAVAGLLTWYALRRRGTHR